MIPMIMGCCAQQSTGEETVPTMFTVSSDGTRKIGITPGVFSGVCTIDWGDGSTQQISEYETVIHTYPAGIYSGTVELPNGAYLEISGDALVSVDNFQEGLISFRFRTTYISDDVQAALSPNLVSVPNQLPQSVTLMFNMFYDATSFNQDISGWSTSNVSNMDGAFRNATSFNQDLSGWCVSNITSKPAFFDQGATSWTLPRPVWGTCPND